MLNKSKRRCTRSLRTKATPHLSRLVVDSRASGGAEDDQIILGKIQGKNENAIKGISETNLNAQTYKDTYNNVRYKDNCADCGLTK